MLCPFCKEEIKDGAIKCKFCGSMIGSEQISEKPQSTQLYNSYDQVPYYRKQWFFWLMYFTISPIAIGILLFGDVYYQKKGEVKSFGLANRIVAGIIAIVILLRIIAALAK